MSRETAPGSAGPRVSDRQPYAGAVLRSYAYHRMEVVRRLANQCVALQDELASLRAQNADLLASEKQRNENICTECGCPRLAKGECLMCENATLRAQNERLREALGNLTGNMPDGAICQWCGCDDDAIPFHDISCPVVLGRNILDALASTDTGETP